MDKKYMSSVEFRNYVHISTRKLKYLLDHNYIPHKTLPQVTHKYQILRTDAAAFKEKMDTDPDFLSELKGMFSARKEPKSRRDRHFSQRDKTRFKKFLAKQWADMPELMCSQQLSKIVQCAPQKLHALAREGVVESLRIQGVQYILKESLIDYLSSPDLLLNPFCKKHQALVDKYVFELRK